MCISPDAPSMAQLILSFSTSPEFDNDSFYGRGSTFPLVIVWLLNDRIPQPQFVGMPILLSRRTLYILVSSGYSSGYNSISAGVGFRVRYGAP